MPALRYGPWKALALEHISIVADRRGNGGARSADEWTNGRVARGVPRDGPLPGAALAGGFTAHLIARGPRTGAPPEGADPIAATELALAAGVLQVLANLGFRIYRRDWSIAAFEDLVALSGASLLAAAAVLVLDLVAEVHAIPIGALVTGAPLALFAQAVLKLRPRWPQIVGAAIGRRSPGETAIVVGAGHTGQLLARDLKGRDSTFRIICFVDDEPNKRGSFVRGIPVSGGLDDLPRLVAKLNPTVVVIAAPRHGALLRRVVDLCEGLDVGVRTFGTFGIHSADGSQLRPVSIDDLLARDAVDLGQSASRGYVRGRRVLITGAAGSIGSELCRQVAELHPSLLMLLDSNESGLHDVAFGLSRDVAVDFFLGDIRNDRWLTHAISQGRPDIIFHAAAYKHVPIIERDPLAGISTNVIGTANLLAAAEASHVAHFVFISSDKAVSPASVLGLTKRFGELLTIGYAKTYAANFSVVRFGNWLGSSASVVPIFTKQIHPGGPVTITTRPPPTYFTTTRTP